jgi:hypothetical protein
MLASSPRLRTRVCATACTQVLADPPHHAIEFGDALAEGGAACRQVEHHEAHQLPLRIARRLLAHDRRGARKLAAPRPKLAIQRRLRPVASEPGRGGDALATAGEQDLAVPVTAHAVELLAHPVVVERNLTAVNVGEHERRRFGGASARRDCGPKCQQNGLADASQRPRLSLSPGSICPSGTRLAVARARFGEPPAALASVGKLCLI